MRCTRCGADLPDGAMFCGECGSGVHPSQEVQLADPGNETRVVPMLPTDPEPGDAEPHDVEPHDVEPDEVEPGEPVEHPDEATRLTFRPSAPVVRFTLHFSTGETVSVQASGLIGRRPVAQPGEYFDEYVTIDDPGRSVSKTHLEYGQDGGVLWISDRFSANGTVVREPGRPPRICPGGTRARVPRGSRVEIGEQFFIVA